MKFSTRQDVDAPIDRVFEMICAFDVYERAAMRRGADVIRLDSLDAPGIGAKWDVQFTMRGKQRFVSLEVVEFDTPTEITVSLSSRNVIGGVHVELFSLSRSRTRMLVGVEVTPITLAARLFLQSLKLTKSSLNRKFENRIAEHAKDIEERHQRSA
ncbi:MAG: SRPBCC family protein [Roseobacter sp.]